MGQTTTKQKAMRNKINNYLVDWPDELIDCMAKHITVNNYRLPYEERYKEAKAMFEKDKEQVINQLLYILDFEDNFCYKDLFKILNKYVSDDYADYYAHELLDTYKQISI